MMTKFSLRTTVCVRFPPEAIATACIYMAARTLKIGLPGIEPIFLVLNIFIKKVLILGGNCLVLIFKRFRRFPEQY